MGTAAEMRMLMVGLSCIALLPCGFAMGVARGSVPERAWGYRRFHANDSLIGQRVPCTHEEKLCFAHNLLFNPRKYKCTWLTSDEFADRQEFLNGSGHLRALGLRDPCNKYGGHRMAYDNKCYKDTLVKDVLCGCNKELSMHILGGAECRCVPAEPLHVEQPPEDGSCIVPDLRFPDIERKHFFRSPYNPIPGLKVRENWGSLNLDSSAPRFHCSPQQLECFSRGQVWLQDDCVPLLERGPCPEEHVVALDATAAANGHVNTTCVHERGGCPPGHVRAAFDGSCHSQDDLRIVVPGPMHRNEFGMLVFLPTDKVSYYSYVRHEPAPEVDKLLKSKENCGINAWINIVHPTLVPVAMPPCAKDDDGKCASYSVHAEAPLPEP